MAGWVKQGSLKGPAGPRGESVLALGTDAPQSPQDGDVWLEVKAGESVQDMLMEMDYDVESITQMIRDRHLGSVGKDPEIDAGERKGSLCY